VLRQFWQVLKAQMPPQELAEAVGELTGRSIWPAQLDAALLDDLPETHGVYLFHDNNDVPLYIGKASNVRQRVLAHFAADQRAAKAMNLSRQVRRVSWVEAPGELGALLKEIQLIHRWQPPHNRRAKSGNAPCTWRLVRHPPDGEADGDPALRPELAPAHEVDWSRHAEPVYGLFGSQKDALKTLKEIAETAQLCLAALGLEQVPAGHACVGFETQQCSGACVGRETPGQHAQRLLRVMADWRVQAWPFSGPVLVREGQGGHVLDAWRYLGTASTDAEVRALLAQERPAFDKDTYKVLVSWLPKVVAEVI
jgi:DNA polymerase-3 subunit epsilon